jgi:hypothetical protein
MAMRVMRERGTLAVVVLVVLGITGLELRVAPRRPAISECCHSITIRTTARNTGCQSQHILECVCGHGAEPLGDHVIVTFLAFAFYIALRCR